MDVESAVVTSCTQLQPELHPKEPQLPDGLAVPLKEPLGQPLLGSRYWHLFFPHLREAIQSPSHHQQDLSIAMANYSCHK